MTTRRACALLWKSWTTTRSCGWTSRKCRGHVRKWRRLLGASAISGTGPRLVRAAPPRAAALDVAEGGSCCRRRLRSSFRVGALQVATPRASRAPCVDPACASKAPRSKRGDTKPPVWRDAAVARRPRVSCRAHGGTSGSSLGSRRAARHRIVALALLLVDLPRACCSSRRGGRRGAPALCGAALRPFLTRGGDTFSLPALSRRWRAEF